MVQQRLWTTDTKASVRGFDSFQRDLEKGLVDTSDTPNNPYSVSFRRVGEIYRSFLRKEFDRNKSGGGAWAPIRKKTLQWRRRKYGITHSQILYVTRTLYGVTAKKYAPAKGHYERRSKYSIAVGVRGGVPHPDFGTIRGLILLHARGGKKLPVRQIIVEADRAALDQMARSFQNAHRIVVKRANSKE